MWCRIHGCNRHARVFYSTLAEFECDSDTGKGIIDAAAYAQLLVTAAPALASRRNIDSCDDLAGRQMQPDDSVVHVEVGDGNPSHTIRPNDLNLRSKAQQSRRRVAGKRRPAGSAIRGHVAEVAVLFETEAATLTPQQRLVVP